MCCDMTWRITLQKNTLWDFMSFKFIEMFYCSEYKLVSTNVSNTHKAMHTLFLEAELSININQVNQGDSIKQKEMRKEPTHITAKKKIKNNLVKQKRRQRNVKSGKNCQDVQITINKMIIIGSLAVIALNLINLNFPIKAIDWLNV